MSFDSDPSYVPDTTNYGIFFLLKVGEPAEWIRLWSGDYDIRVPADLDDTLGGLYTGLDFPLDIPDLDTCLNGMTSSGEFVISGVSVTAIRLLEEDREAVNGSLLYIGVQDFDGTMQRIGSIDWLFEAVAGRPRSSRKGQDESAIYTMTLPWQTDFYDRETAAVSFLSSVSQRLRRGGDAFFDQLAQMSAGMIIKWMQ